MSTVVEFSQGLFGRALKLRVEQYFGSNNLSKRDDLVMYYKACLFIFWAAVSYAILVFYPVNLAHAIASAISLALALVGIGFNVQHDANHGALSRYRWINRTAGMMLDVLGASSFFWRIRHNFLHHTHPNIGAKDPDTNLMPIARLSPEQRGLWFHKYQHFYLWALYTLAHMRHLYADFYRLMERRRNGSEKIPLPKGLELWMFVLGKIAFFSLAFLLPSLFYEWWVVVLFFVCISLFIGTVVGTVFQLAHMVDTVEHMGKLELGGALPSEWAIHQVKTTANFAPTNRVLTFLLGGLNHQLVHHLFPDIAHVHYPAIRQIVNAACEEHGIEVHEFPSVFSALASHFRFLRDMGAAR